MICGRACPGLHIRVTIMHVMATLPLVGGADIAGGTLEQRARVDNHMALCWIA